MVKPAIAQWTLTFDYVHDVDGWMRFGHFKLITGSKALDIRMLCVHGVQSSKDQRCCGKVAKVLVERKCWLSTYVIYHGYRNTVENRVQKQKQKGKRIGITDNRFGRM